MLDQTHLLTLVGAGGIGKTSLAIEAARHAAPDFPEPVCLVELATLNTHEAVLAAIVEGCGLPMSGQQPDIEQVATALGKNRRLLLLDNAEHVIGYVAETVESLIAANALLRVLVTSREPLRIVPETVFRVDPLDVPPPHSTDDEILQRSAVNLFLMRANSLQGQVDVDSRAIQLVGEICRRLDGIPLALELAAARAVALGVEAVHRRLDNRMVMLAGGYRTALPRHQTLRATFDWSFKLLDAVSRMLFRRLAMFSGLFTLEAMCAVVCDDDLPVSAVIDSIGELVAKSMVNVEFSGPVARYRLPESTRAYATDRLEAEGETQLIASRNARYLASQFKPGVGGAAFTRFDSASDLEQTLEDARNATDWAFSDEGDARLGIELTSTLVDALLNCCMIEEVGRRAARAVQAIDSLPPAAVDATSEMQIRAALASVLPNLGGPIRRAADLWHEVLKLAAATANEEFHARALWGMWNAMLSGGNVHEALAWAIRFQQFAHARRSTWKLTLATLLAAVAEHCLGQHAQARAQIESTMQYLAGHPSDAAQISRFAVDPLAICYSGLARIVWLQGEPELAMEFADKAVNLIQPETMEPWLTHVLGVVAVPLALLSGDYRRCKHYLKIMRSQTALHDFEIWHDYAECIAGSLDVIDGYTERGLATLERSLDSLIARGFRRLITPLVVACAEALIAVGRITDASERLRDSLQFCGVNGGLFFLPEVWRVLGVAAQAEAAPGPTDNDVQREKLANAQACFLEAIRMSREHGAKMWELRAALGIARLWHAQGRTEEALGRLDAITGWFDESCRVPEVRALFDLVATLKADVCCER
jgi:predicted ATPase